MAQIRLEIESETGTGSHSASVSVFKCDQLIARVIAKIEPKPGADGGHYPCVTLQKIE